MIPNLLGRQLGNYRLIDLLGQGGFADVYLGEHIHLRTLAAIKILHTHLQDDDVKHFLGEARIIANLNHPSIVRVHDYQVEQGTPFLVMDYATKGTLRKRHPRGVQLVQETLLTYVKQVAAALQYAHRKGVIHRDVKPENLLVGRNGEVLLSDFGVAVISQSRRIEWGVSRTFQRWRKVW